MHSKKFPCILFVFLMLSTFSFAQRVFVANDFGNCGVGLRDSSGKWLAEPVYQRIEEWPDGYFRVLLGSQEGVLDSTGRTVLPPVYEYVMYERANTGNSEELFFTVINGAQTGLANERGEFVVPLVCRAVFVSEDGTIIAEKTKKHYSIYTREGKETVIPKRQACRPVPIGNHLLQVGRNTWHIHYNNRYEYSEWGNISGKGGFSLRKKYGVVNDSLRMILPEKFSDIRYYPGNYDVIGVRRKGKTGYYSSIGKQIWAPVLEHDEYFWQNKYADLQPVQSMFNYLGFTVASYKGKYGMISMNGDTVLPFQYDEISNHYGLGLNSVSAWTVRQANKQGTFNVNSRQWVLPLEFEALHQLASYTKPDSVELINSEVVLRIFAAKKNGKCGIITSEGQELLPFVYDDYTEAGTAEIFRQGNTYLQVSFPEASQYFLGYVGNSDARFVMHAPASLQFREITLENGTKLFISPDRDDSLHRRSDSLRLKISLQNNYVFNPETYNRRLQVTAMVITPLTPSTKFPGVSNTWYVHSTDINYKPEDSCLYYMIYPYGELEVKKIKPVSTDAFHTYYQVGRSGAVFREDGLMLSPARGYSYLRPVSLIDSLRCFELIVGRNKTGLINGNGKLLVDTAYAYVAESNGKYAWVQKKKTLFNRRSWNVLELSSKQLLLPAKMHVDETNDFGSAAVVVEARRGEKLFNLQERKFLLDGKLNEAFPLDENGNYFAVRTCFGNIGIISGSGTWLTDTIWKTLIDANNTNETVPKLHGYSYVSSSTYKYCVLSNDTGWIIFDGDKGAMCKDAQHVHLLLSLAGKALVKDDYTEGNQKKICTICPSYSYDENVKDTLLRSWEEKLLFDSLFTGEHFIADTLFFWLDDLCADCMKKNPHALFQYGWSKNYDRESLHHYISFCNDSCISVSRLLMSSYWYVPNNSHDLFFTALLFPDGPHALQLDSLFEGTAWRKMISDEVTLYFESHPGIEGNCHNPAMLSVMMKDRFVLTPEGILLFPPNYKENRSQLSVLIPWEKAKPYMRKDIIRKLGL